MTEKSKKPRLRFKGFTETWEQRKLMDCSSEIVAGGDIDKNIIKEAGKYPVIANALTDDGIVGYYDDYFRISAPAITVTGRGDVGHAKARKTNFTPVVRLLSIKTTHNEDFIENAINNLNVIIESTGVPQLTVPQLQNYIISLPMKAEEEIKIGLFLVKLNNLITLHQRKYDKFVAIKKALLEKMFPRDGKNVPEIRFKGFTETWEQCKFAEVYSFASEGGTPDTNTAAYYRNGTIPFVRIEDTENKYIDSVKTFITEEGLKHSSAWLIPSGSVIFTNGATVGNVAINHIPVATKQGILGIIPNKTVTAEYLYYLLSSGFFQREVRNRQATGTFATIILKNLNEINVFVPDKAEQQKISGYLSSIDNLITLHQRQLERLKNIKSALLEKMFV